MKYSVDWLLEKISQGEKMDYLFFWGHQPAKDGSIIKTCMSQWWPAPFEENGIVFKTAEHYMMAGKARVFDDPKILEQIVQTDSPKDVKKLGRQIKNFDPVTWDQHKYEIVRNGNKLKFSQHEELKNFLILTQDKVIVEASPMDVIWGIGLSENNQKSQDPKTWRGKNLLGFALMEVRDEIK
jgi:ribA/ribD-fused uncharacterized protein